ncbi:MAG: type II methionyl aminopeptidase [Candidatus Woesearchaeota archaeon]
MGKDYTEQELSDIREACRVTAEAREYGKSLIKVGASMVEVCDRIDKFILDKGYGLAFPAQISLNECAAHYGASLDDPIVFSEKHIAKLDLGAMKDGAPGDTAVTIDLSPDGQYKNLLDASEEALRRAISSVKAGVSTSEIGKEIAKVAEEYGCVPIRNLSGHGIGINDLHGSPKIPNYDTGENVLLEEGMTIAIEPFMTDGAGHVIEKGEPELFMLVGRASVRSPITRKVLQKILEFKGYPFARRYLDKTFGKPRVNFAFKELDNLGVLHKFPPLLDKDGGAVAQSEHSVLVTKDGCEILTE